MTEKITAVLIDDEKGSRHVLLKLLEKKFPQVEVLGEAANVEEAYELLNIVKPQLIFLDIQMPRASGFNLLNKYAVVPFEVIFVTSFDKYAITAIKFNALDYLLKPVDLKELEGAIKKAAANIADKTDKNMQIINLLHHLDTDVKDKKIAVHSGDKVKMLSVQNILYIEADRRYCRLIMNTGESYTTAKNLKDYEDYLAKEPAFLRINKSCIVNVQHIKSYSKGEPFMIEITNGISFEVGRRRKPEILERLKEIN